MICRGCGKKLRNNENICPACGFYNETKSGSLEDDGFQEMDYFEEPGANNNNSDDLFLDDSNVEESYDVPFSDEQDDEGSQEEIDDLLKEKVLGEKPKKQSDKLKEKISEYIGEDNTADFIAAFIGEDYKWIVNKPINIYALLFSWMYFIYRKMYIVGIVGLAITGIIYIVMPILLPILIILSMVLSAVLFNSLYLMFVKAKVQRIVDKYEDETDAFIIEQCIRKGGVNTPIALLIFFIFIALLFLSHFTLTLGGNPSKYWKDNTENVANCLSLGRKTYQLLTDKESKEMINSSLDELACDVILTGQKSYDVYLKVSSDGDSRIVYFANNDGEISLVGDTKYIKILTDAEKTRPLLDDEKEFLENSKILDNKYYEIKNLSSSEENLEKNNKLTGQRTHYVFTKDQIYKKAKNK